MKKIAIGVCCVLLLLACKNKVRESNISSTESAEIIEMTARDTIEAPAEEKAATESPAKKEKNNATESSSYSPRSHQSNDDNMRGFDPPSEDDMDDNGMSRYMEANDDEGWD